MTRTSRVRIRSGRTVLTGTAAGSAALLTIVAEHLAPAQMRTLSSGLALLTVAGLAMVAILAQVAGRLTEDRRVAWVSPLAALYSLASVPTVFGFSPVGGAGWADRALQLGAPVLTAAGVLAGLAGVWNGTVTTAPTVRRIGLAVATVAVAHGYALLAAPGSVTDAVFTAVRVVAVLGLLGAVVTCTHRAILDAEGEQYEWQEELRLAQRDLRRAAERDHELRNAVAGLAGAANLIDPAEPGEESATLRTAMVAELARLDALLGGATHAASEPMPFRVRPVLCQQVALRRCAGMRIELDAELGLGAVGAPGLLAQVMTNVLANCASHAAGSPVWVEARQDGADVRIRVSDLGPGIAVEPGQDVFESGVRGGGSSGQGFGLHICRRLLEQEGGSITIRPRSVDQPGCTVEIRLPTAVANPARTEELATLRRAS